MTQRTKSPARASVKAEPRASRALPDWVPAASLGVLAIAVYANSLSNGFITDDQFQILNNPLVTGAQRLVTAFDRGVWAFLGYRGNYYRPLQFVIYGLLYRAFGPEPLPFHLLMVALHALNTVLLYRLVRRLLGDHRLEAAWIAAAIFAVHPIHTEAVNWIAALPDVLVTTFALVGLSAFAAEECAPNAWQLAMHVCIYLAALLTKETGIMMLPLYAAYQGLLHRGRGARVYAGMAAALSVYLGLRIHSLGGLGHPQGFYQLTAMQFVLSAAVLAAHYFAALIWPVPLNFFHVFRPAGGLSGQLALALLALALIGWAAWRLRNRQPLGAFGILWIAVTIAPALNIPGVGQNVFTERYLYLPSAGFALLIALLWTTFAHARQNWAWKAACTILLLFAAESVSRNFDWKDDFTLLPVTLRQSPESGYLHNLMAGVWVHRDEYRKALEQAELAVQYEPGAPIYRKNLGNMLLGFNPPGAVREFKAFVALQPELGEGHFNLGLAYRALGDNASAAEEFRKAAAIDPRYRPAALAQPIQ